MEVQLSLKSWKVVPDDRTKKAKIVGSYAVVVGDKEIATQAFNGGYQEKDLVFSETTLQAAQALENTIRDELTKLLV